MKLLPNAGPERRRLILMIGALAIIAGAYYLWGGSPKIDYPLLTGPPAAAAPVARPPRAGAVTGRSTAAPVDTSKPQPLRLAEMEQVPDEPNAGRNLFRFGVKPPPPPPPYVAPPPPPPPLPPGPPPIPPIPLKLTTIIADPYAPGRSRAYLVDKTGATFEALEGQIVDGRYKLVKVGTTSVVMSYLDGTGQRTIALGGG